MLDSMICTLEYLIQDFPSDKCESVATTATLFLYFVVCMQEVQNCLGTNATEHGSECER